MPVRFLLQVFVFCPFRQFGDRHAVPARYELVGVVCGHSLLQHRAGVLLGLDIRRLRCEWRAPAVGQLAGFLELAPALSICEIDPQGVQL